MDIFQIIAVALIGALLSITLKSYRPELAAIVGIATGILVIFMTVDSIAALFSAFEEIVEKSGIDARYFKLVVKIIGIAYISQFAGELLKDCGEGAIALKVEFAGKLCIMLLALPIISGFLDIVIKTLADF